MLKVAGGMEERRLQQLFQFIFLDREKDGGKGMDRAVKKKYCQFFQSGLKTPVSENMDQKELKNFLEQKSRSLLSSPSEDSRSIP